MEGDEDWEWEEGREERLVKRERRKGSRGKKVKERSSGKMNTKGKEKISGTEKRVRERP